MAKNDYDTMPIHTFKDNLSPRYRNFGKSREQTRDAQLREMSSRELDSRGLSPRGPQRNFSPLHRASNRLLNSAGSGQHPTVTSQNAPAWMAGSQNVTTKVRERPRGIRMF